MLVTKINSSKNNYSRKRLFNIMAQAFVKSFVLIVAGVGHGKSFALASYLEEQQGEIRWIKMQKLDNITARFWKHFIDSIFVNDDQMAQRFMALGFPETLAAFDIFLHMLAQTLEANKKHILIFDDFYLVEEQQVHGFIEKLALAKLFSVTIVVVLRKVDNTVFLRLRLKEFAAEIDEKDMQFSVEEIYEYFTSLGFALSDEEASEIYDYTGGLAFAIYLISVALCKNDFATQSILSAAKSNISDLIENEMFFPCSYRLQNLLIKLSLFDNIPIAMLKEIFCDCHSVIDEMLETSLIISVDQFSKEYRIHNIFSDFLKQKQSLLFSEEVEEIQIKAGNWYRKNGYQIDAMNCYKQANNYKDVLLIILEHKTRCTEKLANIYLVTIDDFPEEFILQNPIIHAVRAKFLVNNSMFKEAFEYLTYNRQRIESLIRNTENADTILTEALGEIYIILALISGIARKIEFVELFQMADKCLPNGSKVVNNKTELSGGNIVTLVDNPEPGQFKVMVDAFFAAIPYATKVMNGCAMGIDYLAAAEMTFNMGDLKNAEKNSYQSIYKARQTEQNDIEIMAYFFLIRIDIAKGNYEHAKELVGLLKTKRNSNLSAVCLNAIDVAISWFYAIIGDVAGVSTWIASTGEQSDGREELSPISVGIDILIRGRCYLVMKEYQKLLLLFQNTKSFYGIDSFLIALIEVEILKSICLFNTGKTSESLACFEKAYNLSHGNLLVMPFIEYGEHIKPILQAIRTNKSIKIPRSWLGKIAMEASAYAKHLANSVAEHNGAIVNCEIQRLSLIVQS